MTTFYGFCPHAFTFSPTHIDKQIMQIFADLNSTNWVLHIISHKQHFLVPVNDLTLQFRKYSKVCQELVHFWFSYGLT